MPPANPHTSDWQPRHERVCGLRRGRTDTKGAVFVEFLIAFLPVFTFFLCLLQLGFLFTVRLVTEHAAIVSARAAAVVIGDDAKRYNNETLNELKPGNGKRYDAIRQAALFALAPLILDGTVESVDLEFPPPEQPGGAAQTGPTIAFSPMTADTVQKVRVRLVVQAACKIAIANRIACRTDWFSAISGIQNPFRPYPLQVVRAEAIYPYQGANYAYP